MVLSKVGDRRSLSGFGSRVKGNIADRVAAAVATLSLPMLHAVFAPENWPLAWYLRAAGQGNALAVKRIDQLKSHMQPDEIDAADKLSKELMTKPPEKTDTPPVTEVPPAEKPAPAPSP